MKRFFSLLATAAILTIGVLYAAAPSSQWEKMIKKGVKEVVKTFEKEVVNTVKKEYKKYEKEIEKEIDKRSTPDHKAPKVILGSPNIKHNDRQLNPAWAELPEIVEGQNIVHKTYFTTLNNGKRVRNYSICYDKSKMVSLWVAYPLHEVYTTPKIDRTNAWAFDDAVTTYGEGGYDIVRYEYTEPQIPQHLQPYVQKGGFNDGENRQLDRGHMLPSASRYNSWTTNAQTFYATNIFPQNARLNQQNWARVEDATRDCICSDTLYVVVGTLFEEPSSFVSRGRHIARPSHCYKLLLRTRNGETGKSISEITDADELMAIGFLYENSSAGNVEPYRAVVSIAEVERRSGIKFFPNINPTIEKQVKEQKNITHWSGFR